MLDDPSVIKSALLGGGGVANRRHRGCAPLDGVQPLIILIVLLINQYSLVLLLSDLVSLWTLRLSHNLRQYLLLSVQLRLKLDDGADPLNGLEITLLYVVL